jgi:hypothetical protein
MQFSLQYILLILNKYTQENSAPTDVDFDRIMVRPNIFNMSPNQNFGVGSLISYLDPLTKNRRIYEIIGNEINILFYIPDDQFESNIVKKIGIRGKIKGVEIDCGIEVRGVYEIDILSLLFDQFNFHRYILRLIINRSVNINQLIKQQLFFTDYHTNITNIFYVFTSSWNNSRLSMIDLPKLIDQKLKYTIQNLNILNNSVIISSIADNMIYFVCNENKRSDSIISTCVTAPIVDGMSTYAYSWEKKTPNSETEPINTWEGNLKTNESNQLFTFSIINQSNTVQVVDFIVSNEDVMNAYYDECRLQSLNVEPVELSPQAQQNNDIYPINTGIEVIDPIIDTEELNDPITNSNVTQFSLHKNITGKTFNPYLRNSDISVEMVFNVSQ